jgi:hypothetical protein
MPATPESIDNLSIRCPSCRQRFSVGGDLRDRMVECGACDTRFRINEDVIIRSKKFYPGERDAHDLNRFQRVPLSAAAPDGLQTIRYAEFSHPERLLPASPQRILAGVIGVGTMALIALMLIFSSGPGASFGAMPLENKLVIAGFVSALGIGLLVYANPKARAKAAFYGLLLSAGLVSLPFFFKGTPIAARPGSVTYTDPIEPLFPVETEETDSITALRARFTTKPLEAEQTRHEEAGGGKKAYGIYLTKLQQRNIYTVRDFLIRETRADLSSHPYPRDEGDYLMILTEVSMDIAQVAKIAGRLGSTKEIHPEIGVIVVTVDNTQFEDGAADKLNDPMDPAFYDLNRRELASLDMDRVERAVGRLAGAEPRLYRSDISAGLVGLMSNPGVRFHDPLARALLVWAEDPGSAGEAALKVLRQKIEAGEPVSENLVALVAKAEIKEAIPYVQSLWIGNPLIWEKHFVGFGPMIEPGVLGQLDTDEPPLRHSAIRLLGQVGTDACLPALRKLVATGDPEIRVLAERAIARITER